MIKVNGVVVNQKHFPDNSLLLKLDPYKDIRVFFDDVEIEWLYENDAELFTLICLKRHLDKDFKNIYLSLPYVPHARMDREKEDEDVFTLKYFCEVINSLNFEMVQVRDAHSNVSLALLNNVYQEDVGYFIYEAIKKSNAEVLFYPDEGAMKRYSANTDKPYAFGVKRRDWKTGNILGLDIINEELVKDKNILIVDDICSKGGTFLHSAKALKAAGAKSVSLYVTHLEKTVTTGELAKTDGLVDHIYTTESIFPEELLTDNFYDPYWREWITILKWKGVCRIE